MERPNWRVVDSSYVVDSRFLRLRKDTIELPDGTIVPEYYVKESRGFVVIFALTQDGSVILVRQYKHGAGRVLLELPAGAIDPGETPLHCAVRELAEETGYEAGSIEFVRSFITDPTNADTIAHLFLARGARKTSEQSLDITENIQVELVTVDELRRLVRDGTIDVMPQVAAIYTVLENLRTMQP